MNIKVETLQMTLEEKNDIIEELQSKLDSYEKKSQNYEAEVHKQIKLLKIYKEKRKAAI